MHVMRVAFETCWLMRIILGVFVGEKGGFLRSKVGFIYLTIIEGEGPVLPCVLLQGD